LNENDFSRAATALMVEIAAVKAVLAVEAKGSGFFEDGSCVILYERHKFYNELLKKKPQADVIRLATGNPSIINSQSGGYVGGMAEYNRLNMAIAIDQNCALKAASWGLFQIMGFNHLLAGYATVEAFVADMKLSEAKQLDAFVNFVKSQPGMLKALRAKDWAEFARLYNGSKYKENQYDTKLATEFKAAQ
jgi:hypothetical protein